MNERHTDHLRQWVDTCIHRHRETLACVLPSAARTLPSEGDDVPTPEPSPGLTELARAYGVATEYWDWQGNRVIVGAL